MYEILSFPEGVTYKYEWYDVIDNVDVIGDGMAFSKNKVVALTKGDWSRVNGGTSIDPLPGRTSIYPNACDIICYIDNDMQINNSRSFLKCADRGYNGPNIIYGLKNIHMSGSDFSNTFEHLMNGESISRIPSDKVLRIMENNSRLLDEMDIDTSEATTMSSMFSNCRVLMRSPRLDASNVTNVSQMFYYVGNLREIQDFNCVKLTNFGGSSYSSWLYSCPYIEKIGVVDCDSVTNIAYFFGNSTLTYLTDFGGCRNLGKASSVSNTNGSYFMTMAPNLTYESVMNVINGLYDRATAGLSVLTLKLHANHLAMLSEDDIAIATNKGWTIV